MQLDSRDLDAWCVGYWRRYRDAAESRADAVRRLQAKLGDREGERVWSRVRDRVCEMSRNAASPKAS